MAKIFPSLLAIFVAVKVFQASGVFELARQRLAGAFASLGVPPEVLSVALVKSFPEARPRRSLPISSRPPARIRRRTGLPPSSSGARRRPSMSWPCIWGR